MDRFYFPTGLAKEIFRDLGTIFRLFWEVFKFSIIKKYPENKQTMQCLFLEFVNSNYETFDETASTKNIIVKVSRTIAF